MAWLRYPPAGGGPEGGAGGAALQDRDGIDLRPAQAALVRAGLRRGLPPVRPRPPGRRCTGGVGPRVMDAEYAPKVVRYLEGEVREVEVEQVPGDYGEYYRNVGAAIRESHLWRWSRRTCCTPSVSSWRRSAPRSAVPRWKAQTRQTRQTREGRLDPSLPRARAGAGAGGACTSCTTTPGPPAPASPAPATTCCSSPCARREERAGGRVPPASPDGVGAGGYGAGIPILFPFPNRVRGEVLLRGAGVPAGRQRDSAGQPHPRPGGAGPLEGGRDRRQR